MGLAAVWGPKSGDGYWPLAESFHSLSLSFYNSIFKVYFRKKNVYLGG